MNKVVHFEIPAQDYQRAKDFYSNLFGWKISEYPGAPTKYGMAETVESNPQGVMRETGGINGAIMESDGTVNTTIVTIAVDSIDSYLDKIAAMGGSTVSQKQKVGDMGYMARFKDPEGNLVGLWENIDKG